METLIIVFHVLAAICVISLVLIQQGKGADMGASFGSGASQTLFGSRGSGNALTRATAILATIFFATSLALSVVARHHAENAGLVDMPAPAAMEIPVAPAPTKPVDEVPSVEHNSAPAAGEVPSTPAAPQ
ncbi:MAG: secG [Verrucomicrobiaceae bacterium]|nr:secG [Verrucomicrobiaceae bacterium]